MFKSVSFNIFEKNLQGIVYRRKKKDTVREKSLNIRSGPTAFDDPIPQPVPDFWRPNFISKFINYKPLSAK